MKKCENGKCVRFIFVQEVLLSASHGAEMLEMELIESTWFFY